MIEKDIILTAMSCGGKMHCAKEAEQFDEPPLVIAVPGGSADGFRRTAQEHRAHHSVLDGFLASRRELSAVRPRRVCLVAASEGWAWIYAILKAKRDLERLDVVIVLDGIDGGGLKAWVDYTALAAKGGRHTPKLWLVHSQGRTSKTNRKIVSLGTSETGRSDAARIPAYITKAGKHSPPIRVYTKGATPTTKLYHEDPLLGHEQIGNAVRLEFEGNQPQDSIYISQHVQPRLWQWLRELWAAKDAGVFFSRKQDESTCTVHPGDASDDHNAG